MAHNFHKSLRSSDKKVELPMKKKKAISPEIKIPKYTETKTINIEIIGKKKIREIVKNSNLNYNAIKIQKSLGKNVYLRIRPNNDKV